MFLNPSVFFGLLILGVVLLVGIPILLLTSMGGGGRNYMTNALRLSYMSFCIALVVGLIASVALIF